MKTLHDLLGGFRLDQASHDALVRRTAIALTNAGCFNVHADVSGYLTPGRIYWERTGEGHVPDVTGGPYVIEVETADSLDSDHTKSQCELFSAFAREKGFTFVVVVPVGCKNDMEWQLLGWGISGTVWEF